MPHRPARRKGDRVRRAQHEQLAGAEAKGRRAVLAVQPLLHADHVGDHVGVGPRPDHEPLRPRVGSPRRAGVAVVVRRRLHQTRRPRGGRAEPRAQVGEEPIEGGVRARVVVRDHKEIDVGRPLAGGELHLRVGGVAVEHQRVEDGATRDDLEGGGEAG